MIDRDVTIQGAGEDLTVIDGQGQGTVVEIVSGSTVAIKGITIQGGLGGGIRNVDGTLTLTNSTVTDNTAKAVASSTSTGARSSSRTAPLPTTRRTVGAGASSTAPSARPPSGTAPSLTIQRAATSSMATTSSASAGAP